MRLWYFSSSVNSFFKRACAATQWGRDVWFLVGLFVYCYTSCVRTAKALTRLRRCAGSPEPSLVAYVISTIISWPSSNVVSKTRYNKKALRPVTIQPYKNRTTSGPLPHKGVPGGDFYCALIFTLGSGSIITWYHFHSWRVCQQLVFWWWLIKF